MRFAQIFILYYESLDGNVNLYFEYFNIRLLNYRLFTSFEIKLETL